MRQVAPAAVATAAAVPLRVPSVSAPRPVLVLLLVALAAQWTLLGGRPPLAVRQLGGVLVVDGDLRLGPPLRDAASVLWGTSPCPFLDATAASL